MIGGSGEPACAANAAGRLDLRGLRCPLPVLRLGSALGRLAPGAVLEVLTTDPMAVIDIPHFCRSEGHAVLDVRRGDEEHCFIVRKQG